MLPRSSIVRLWRSAPGPIPRYRHPGSQLRDKISTKASLEVFRFISRARITLISADHDHVNEGPAMTATFA